MSGGKWFAFWLGWWIALGIALSAPARADWLATVSRHDHYQQLIVDAQSRQAQWYLLQAASRDPELSQGELEDLREDFERCRPPYIVVQTPQTRASAP